jgi:hypothetical protein
MCCIALTKPHFILSSLGLTNPSTKYQCKNLMHLYVSHFQTTFLHLESALIYRITTQVIGHGVQHTTGPAMATDVKIAGSSEFDYPRPSTVWLCKFYFFLSFLRPCVAKFLQVLLSSVVPFVVLSSYHRIFALDHSTYAFTSQFSFPHSDMYEAP